MKGYQRIEIMGNVGSDPEFKHGGNTPLLKFSVAVNGFRDDDPPEWFNVVIWDKQAEAFEKYISKGDPIFIAGEQRSRDYEDNDGNKRRWVELNARDVRLLGGKKESERDDQRGRGDRDGGRDRDRGGNGDRDRNRGGNRDNRGRNESRNDRGGRDRGRDERGNDRNDRREERERSGGDDNPFRD